MRQREDGYEASGTRAVLAMLLLVGCASEAPIEPHDAGTDAGDAGTQVTDAGSDADSDAGGDAGLVPHLAANAPEDRFFEHQDAPLREALADEPIQSVTRGHGGRSLAFRIVLADGTIGYFKPEQRFSGMKWYAEIAAYHLDRELGLNRVAPVVSRRVAWSELEAAAEGDHRVEEIAIDEEGFVRGAFVWWVPSRPTPLPLPAGWEAWLRIDDAIPAVTPYQPADDFRAGLEQATDLAVPEADRPDRIAEMSDLIVFDFLARNGDRWGTNNVNVRTVGPGGPLMFLDNAASFVLRTPSNGLMDARIGHVQRFRRSTIDAIRRFDIERYSERLDQEPLAPILDARQIHNLEARRVQLLAQVDALIAEHGEEAILAF